MWMRIKKREAQGPRRWAQGAEGEAQSAVRREYAPQYPGKINRWIRWAGIFTLLVWCCPSVWADPLKLQDLIEEALRNNPELGASQAGVQAAGHKIPQAGSLPDPMIMLGYQNEGYNTYNFGESPDAQWMVSVSQMFPFYGKRELKAEMAGRDAESMKNVYRTLRLKTIIKVKEHYNDLF